MRSSSFRRSFRFWWVLTGLLVCCGLVAWWSIRRPVPVPLEGEALAMVQAATDRGAIALWVQHPTSVVEILSSFVDDPSAEVVGASATEQALGRFLDPDVTKILRRSKEIVVVVDELGFAAVQVRLSGFAAVVTKGLGILTSNPWLSGGRVEVGGQKAKIGWQSGGGFVANRWMLRREGFSLQIKAEDLEADEKQRSKSASGYSAEYAAVLALPDLDYASGVWGMLALERGKGLRWQRLQGEERSSPSAASAFAEPLWWPVDSGGGNSLLGLGDAERAVLGAVQRSSDGWQTILWLDSPIALDGLSVRIEVPRAAILQTSSARPWKLPAEDAARQLSARLASRTTSSGADLRFSNLDAAAALERQEGRLENWAIAAPEGAFAGWVNPESLTLWFEAIATLERTLPGPPSSAIFQKLRQSAPLGEALSNLRPIQFFLTGDRLALRVGEVGVGRR